jgi:hypothetical protein
MPENASVSHLEEGQSLCSLAVCSYFGPSFRNFSEFRIPAVMSGRQKVQPCWHTVVVSKAFAVSGGASIKITDTPFVESKRSYRRADASPVIGTRCQFAHSDCDSHSDIMALRMGIMQSEDNIRLVPPAPKCRDPQLILQCRELIPDVAPEAGLMREALGVEQCHAATASVGEVELVACI